MGILDFLFGKKKEARPGPATGDSLPAEAVAANRHAETRKEDKLEDGILCSDGNCIGTIGPDGRCNVCGKRSSKPPSSERHNAFDWRTSKAHRLLLSRFLSAQSAKTFPSGWEEALGEPPQRAADRFLSEGWLIPASSSSRLDRAFNGTEIRNMLREHGLRVSGRKREGIERLIAADPEGMAAKVAHLDYVECSPSARETAERFLAEEKTEREGADASCLEQLRLGDLSGASTTVAQFEAKQVFPRGLGVDWTNPDMVGNIGLLDGIFEARPKILAGLEESDWAPLRVAAAMMHLWGTNRASQWLPANFVGIPKFDHDTAARMILFFAQHRANAASWRKAGLRIKKVEILGTADSCPACAKLAGKRFTIDNIPELPYEKCSNEIGCRCEALPIIE
jgi:hypothetical protein